MGLLAGVIGAISAGSAVVDAIKGDPSTSCPGQPNSEAVALMQVITATDLETLASYFTGDAANRIRSRDPYALAHAVAGGSDCKASSKAGQAAITAFWDAVRAYSSNGSGGVPLVTPAPSSGGGGILGPIKDKIVDPVVDTITNIGKGAVAGAGAAASGGAAGSGAAVTTSVLGGALLPIMALALGALILIPVLRK